MNYEVSFQELAKIQQKILLKQQPVTLEKAKQQVAALRQSSSQKVRKQRS